MRVIKACGCRYGYHVFVLSASVMALLPNRPGPRAASGNDLRVVIRSCDDVHRRVCIAGAATRGRRSCSRAAPGCMRSPCRRFIRRRHRARRRAASIAGPRGPQRRLLLGLRRPIASAAAAAIARAAGEALQVDGDLDAGGVAADAAAAALQAALPLQAARVAARVPVAACEGQLANLVGRLLRHRGAPIILPSQVTHRISTDALDDAVHSNWQHWRSS